MGNQNKINVLYVDDEINNLNSFNASFRRDFNIFTATSGKEGLDILRNNKIHIIITDQRMPEMTGVSFLVEVLKEFPDPIRLLLTGYADMEAVIEAVNKGKIYYYLTKPWDEQGIKVIIKNAYELYDTREKLVQLTEELKIANEQLEFIARQKLLS